MDPQDALWQVFGFFAPALGTGVIGSLLAKLWWPRALASTPFGWLAAWAVATGAATLCAGLLVSGHDGRMGTYVALVLTTAATLWWKGLRGR